MGEALFTVSLAFGHSTSVDDRAVTTSHMILSQLMALERWVILTDIGM